MDTITHVLTGVLAGMVASRVTGNNESASIIVAVFSSVISDIDVISKVFGERNYLRIHRSHTHQIHTAILLSLVAPIIFLSRTYDHFIYFYILSLIAILLHLFLDTLNPYGTKIIPFYKRIKLNIVSTVDIFIMFLLVINISAVKQGVFGFLWLFIMYFLIRFIVYKVILHRLKNHYKVRKVHLLSTYNPFKWHVMLELSDKYIVASIYFLKMCNEEVIIKEYVDMKYLSKVYTTKEYKSFAQLAYLYKIEVTTKDDITSIILYDLKYRKGDKYFFKLRVNFKNDQIISTYLGFSFKDNADYKTLTKNAENL